MKIKRIVLTVMVAVALLVAGAVSWEEYGRWQAAQPVKVPVEVLQAKMVEVPKYFFEEALKPYLPHAYPVNEAALRYTSEQALLVGPERPHLAGSPESLPMVTLFFHNVQEGETTIGRLYYDVLITDEFFWWGEHAIGLLSNPPTFPFGAPKVRVPIFKFYLPPSNQSVLANQEGDSWILLDAGLVENGASWLTTTKENGVNVLNVDRPAMEEVMKETALRVMAVNLQEARVLNGAVQGTIPKAAVPEGLWRSAIVASEEAWGVLYSRQELALLHSAWQASFLLMEALENLVDVVIREKLPPSLHGEFSLHYRAMRVAQDTSLAQMYQSYFPELASSYAMSPRFLESWLFALVTLLWAVCHWHRSFSAAIRAAIARCGDVPPEAVTMVKEGYKRWHMFPRSQEVMEETIAAVFSIEKRRREEEELHLRANEVWQQLGEVAQANGFIACNPSVWSTYKHLFQTSMSPNADLTAKQAALVELEVAAKTIHAFQRPVTVPVVRPTARQSETREDRKRRYDLEKIIREKLSRYLSEKQLGRLVSMVRRDIIRKEECTALCNRATTLAQDREFWQAAERGELILGTAETAAS